MKLKSVLPTVLFVGLAGLLLASLALNFSQASEIALWKTGASQLTYGGKQVEKPTDINLFLDEYEAMKKENEGFKRTTEVRINPEIKKY